MHGYTPSVTLGCVHLRARVICVSAREHTLVCTRECMIVRVHVCVCVCVEVEHTGYRSDMCKVILSLITLPNSVQCCCFFRTCVK
jgi:hypothetical protein